MKRLLTLFCIAIFLPLLSTYYSQFEQDKYVNEEIFKGKKKGVFFDIGSYDGILDSNSYFFEKHLEWTGICVEPVDFLFNQMSKIRSCICLQGCIWNKTGPAQFIKVIRPDGSGHGWSGLVDSYDSRHLNYLENVFVKEQNCILEKIIVNAYKFNDICKQHKIKKIDYLSIDTEGSELDILKSINFENIFIDIIGVENNYNDADIRTFLESKNYLFLKRVGVDDFYRKNIRY